MNMNYLIYNPEAGNGNCREETEILEVVYENTVLIDINSVRSYQVFFSGLDESDSVILCGGDGSLHRFINDTVNVEIKCHLYFYALGVCNDFARDLGMKNGDTPDVTINKYLKDLPVVTIQGKKIRFLNGIGFGLDGFAFVCRDDYQHVRENSEICQILSLIRGFLFRYQPVSMDVIRDGELHRYERVWMAHTMKGKYLSGLKSASDQCRSSKERTLSFVTVSGVGRLRALHAVLAMVKGKKPKAGHGVEILQGSQFCVSFEKPVSLQVDGDKLPTEGCYEVWNG